MWLLHLSGFREGSLEDLYTDELLEVAFGDLSVRAWEGDCRKHNCFCEELAGPCLGEA